MVQALDIRVPSCKKEQAIEGKQPLPLMVYVVPCISLRFFLRFVVPETFPKVLVVRGTVQIGSEIQKLCNLLILLTSLIQKS